MYTHVNRIANKKVSKDELRKEIEISQQNQEATQKFMEIIYIIAYKLLRTNKFRNTTTIDWMEDAASSAVIKFSQNYDKFNLSKKNKFGEPCSPYSFYMTAIKRSIYDTFNSEYKFFDLKRDLMKYNSAINEDGLDPFWDQLYEEDTHESHGEVEIIDKEDY